ncbi:hypothetical protein ACFE04_010649 [Oxalis oulophora]
MKPESSQRKSNLKKKPFDFRQVSKSLNEIDQIIKEEKKMIKTVDNPLNNFLEISEALQVVQKRSILRETKLKKNLFKKIFAQKMRQISSLASLSDDEIIRVCEYDDGVNYMQGLHALKSTR